MIKNKACKNSFFIAAAEFFSDSKKYIMKRSFFVQRFSYSVDEKRKAVVGIKILVCIFYKFLQILSFTAKILSTFC